MSTEEMIAIAYGHFVIHSKDKIHYVSVLVQYAQEELTLSETEIPDFIVHATFGEPDEIDCREDNHFYIWYYLNYVLPKEYSLQYDIHILWQTIPFFIRTEIWPVRTITESDNTIFQYCDPDQADFWAVYMYMSEGKSICIAECKNQTAAQNMESFIHNVSKNNLVR